MKKEKLIKFIEDRISNSINNAINAKTYVMQEYDQKRRIEDPLYLDRYGFKVFSQNDEDGIIEEIFRRIGVTDKHFIEFGVQNGLESNGHYLLHKGWTGLWMDGGKEYCEDIKSMFSKVIESGRLTVKNAFITTENINDLLCEWMETTGGGHPIEIDLLSIDIDGNDWHIWKAIKSISPRVVTIEYNAKFPPNHEWIMEYKADYVWRGDDEYGASLKAMEVLGREKGYKLVGTNTNGVNAFFVREDLVGDLFATPNTAENMYNVGSANSHKFVNGNAPTRYIGI